MVVVPVPMPWQRRMYRGIDHTRVLAASCARTLRLPLCPVLRKRNGPAQMTLTATQRRVNLRGRLDARRGARRGSLADTTVVLIDDVLTTGTTLNASARILKNACGAGRVIAAVVAVTDGGRRAKRAPDIPPGDRP